MHEIRWQSLHPQWFSGAALRGIFPGTSRPALPWYKCSCWNPKATSNGAAACSQPIRTVQSGYWAVQMESIQPAAVILQSLQLHIAIPANWNPCNYYFPSAFFFFFPTSDWDQWSEQFSQASHTGCWADWDLLEAGEKRQMPLLTSPPSRTFLDSGLWVGGGKASKGMLIWRKAQGREKLKTNCSTKKGAQVSA